MDGREGDLLSFRKPTLNRRLWPGAAAAGVLALPALSVACPQCVNSTPYGSGLIYAVAFIMPIPFALVGFLVWWIARHSPSSQNPDPTGPHSVSIPENHDA